VYRKDGRAWVAMSWPRFLRRDELRRCLDSTRYAGRSRVESGYLPW